MLHARADAGHRRVIVALLGVAALGLVPARALQASSSLSPRLRDAVDLGRSTSAGLRHVVVGLSLRDRAGLEASLTNRRLLTPDEFAAAHAPAPEPEAALVAHLEASGLVVTERFPNRLLVGAVGSAAAVERAFGVELHDVFLDGALHFAVRSEPTLPPGVAESVLGVVGLDDLSRARPHVRARGAAPPRAFADLAEAYDRIVTDDPGLIVVTSWGACEANLAPAVQDIDDEIFAAGAAIGQAWFAASGDHGATDCRGERGGHHRLVNVDHPANSPHVVGVGGTKPVCSAGLIAADPACRGYGGERAWSASGGGVSAVFARPAFQTGCGLPVSGGRLV